MATKHINAEAGDFAATVVMPGDPLRAQYIAENYLSGAQRVCDTRNMYGYTGDYQGRRLSVMAHGMGIPSCSIYCTELIQSFGVKRIIRAGSCGSVSDEVALRDVIIAMGASTDSAVNRIRFRQYDFAPIASYDLLRTAVDIARAREFTCHVGNIFSADLFYTPDPEAFETMAKLGILGVEMELAGIYGLCAEFGAEALGICTVSDHIPSGAELTADERQTTFDDMIRLALDTAAEFETGA